MGDEKPKFDWTKPVQIWKMQNVGDVRFHGSDGQLIEPRMLDCNYARDALFDLHNRLDCVEHGRPTFAWVRDLEERICEQDRVIEKLNLRVRALAGREAPETDEEQLADLKAKVVQFVEWYTGGCSWQGGMDKLRELGLMEK